MRFPFLLIIMLLLSCLSFAQQKIFEEVPVSKVKLSKEDAARQSKVNALKKVKGVRTVKINLKALNDESFNISFDSKSVAVKKWNVKTISSEEYSWFGQLEDGTGIFFTRIGNKLASKFYLNNIPYTLIPLNDDYHLLIEFDKQIDNGVCGTPSNNDIGIANDRSEAKSNSLLALESSCRMRVVLVVTAEAEPEILMPLELAARMLEDETNLAYMQSQVSYRMEIARVVRTSYVETTSYQNSTEYGAAGPYPTDLLNLRNGAGLLSNIPALRNLYSADLVVMARSEATNNAQGFYGVALGIPTGSYLPDDNNAFGIISTIYMIGGRFTFAHEIGHIQGLRHENHAATPTYARGYIFSAGSTNNRTIMCNGCADPTTGCRIQFFSNPNLTYSGVPIGVANQYDEVRRINETANDVLNFRTTPTNLLLSNETFDSEILARHVASNSISTNNSTVVASSQSRVSFKAENEVVLLPGFEANSGSEFVAHLGDCGDASLLSATIPINIKEIETSEPSSSNSRGTKNGKIKIYPNPNNGAITLEAADRGYFDHTVIRIFNSVGTMVVETHLKSGSTRQILNFENLPSGVYYIQVSQKSKVQLYEKIIISK